VPRILKISPAAIRSGSSAFILRVYDRLDGETPIDGATVFWNGSPRPTSRGYPACPTLCPSPYPTSWLDANITADDVVMAQSVSTTVSYPAPGGGTSSPETLVVDSTNLRSPCDSCSIKAGFPRTIEPR
jgi:hypothetical protein